MGSQAVKKARIIPEYEGADRISALPDELIHEIMSFLDAEEAVQTSVLSKRWKLVWTSLPFLNFIRPGNYLPVTAQSRYIMLIYHVLSNRNHQSSVSELKLNVSVELTGSGEKFHRCAVKKFIEYAVSHSVQDLSISLGRCSTAKPYKLCTFSSKSLKKMKLRLSLDKEFALGTDCWDLPALTTLHLGPPMSYYRKLPELWLTCLPALRTLILDIWDLSDISFSLPNLSTLRLHGCTLPGRVWNLPALLSLHLDSLPLPENMSDMFSTLVNLKHLTLSSVWESTQRDLLISCPQLLNLDIRMDFDCDLPAVKNIVVSAPQLCNFTSFGIFSIKVEGPDKLENVNINLKDVFKYGGRTKKKKCYQQFTCMLSGLGTAKNLSFDLKSIEALSEMSNFLASSFSPFFNLEYVKVPKEYKQLTMSRALRSYLLNGSRGAIIVKSLPQALAEIINIQASVSSPFINLKYLKLPKEYKETSLSSALRSYLLGGCPRARIVTKLPQENLIPQTATVSMTVGTKGLVDSQYMIKTVNIETGDLGIQQQHVAENSLLDADRVRQIDSLAEGTSINRVSSLKGKRDFGLWRGYEVNPEFICLLDCIMQKYPETFKHFTTNNKKLSTVRLNMLCTSLKDFTKISMADVDSEIIAQYRDIFTYLQSMGFNLSWVLSHLNYIEHQQFSIPLITEPQAIDCRIDDAKSEVQDLQARVGDAIYKLQRLQTLRAEKITEIEKKRGTCDANLSVVLIGDDLLSGP